MSTTDLKQDAPTAKVDNTDTIAEVVEPKVEKTETIVEPKVDAQAGGALAFSELKGGKKSQKNRRSQKNKQSKKNKQKNKQNQKHGGSKKNKHSSSKRHQKGGKWMHNISH